MKKLFSILMSVLMAATVFLASGASASAEDSGILPIDLNTKYEAAFEKTDDYSKSAKKYYDYFEFSVPAKGKVTLTVSSKLKGYTSPYVRYYILSKKGKGTWSPDNKKFSGKWSTTLKKGKYYFVAEYQKTSKKSGKMLGGTYTFKLGYKAAVAKVNLKKAVPKTAAVKLSWAKAAGVTGYAVEYSRDKKFSVSEALDVEGADTVSTKVKELKSNKKYYLRVRAYKTVRIAGKNKTYYGKWSKVLTAKTK